MLKRYPFAFSQLMMTLCDLRGAMYADKLDDGIKDSAISAEDLGDLQAQLVLASVLTKELDMDAAFILTERMIKSARFGYTAEELHGELRDLISRIEDQLKSRNFLYVPPKLVDYYRSPMLFGQDVNDKFPAAIADIEDAGKCLAVGSGTSAVMHLMRVMEVGLKALAKALKIKYAPSWEQYLTQIATKIGAKHKTKGIKWKKDEKFYRDVSGDLLTVKQAWRNPTMHIDRRYSVDEAEEIFKAVRALMLRLSAKLTG